MNDWDEREPNPNIDKGRIEKAVREILEAIGEDPDRDGLQRTPTRIADAYAEIFSGLHDDPSRYLKVTFEADHDEMVMVRDIPLFGMCEHHLLPFAGRAHVAYIPGVRRSYHRTVEDRPSCRGLRRDVRRCKSGSPRRSPTR